MWEPCLKKKFKQKHLAIVSGSGVKQAHRKQWEGQCMLFKKTCDSSKNESGMQRHRFTTINTKFRFLMFLI